MDDADDWVFVSAVSHPETRQNSRMMLIPFQRRATRVLVVQTSSCPSKSGLTVLIVPRVRCKDGKCLTTKLMEDVSATVSIRTRAKSRHETRPQTAFAGAPKRPSTAVSFAMICLTFGSHTLYRSDQVSRAKVRRGDGQLSWDHY